LPRTNSRRSDTVRASQPRTTSAISDPIWPRYWINNDTKPSMRLSIRARIDASSCIERARAIMLESSVERMCDCGFDKSCISRSATPSQADPIQALTSASSNNKFFKRWSFSLCSGDVIKSSANFLTAARNCCRTPNPERMTKKNRDRKPVREPSDYPGLRPCAHQLDQPPLRGCEVRSSGDHDHERQEPRCRETVAPQRTSHLYFVCR